jgi:anti-sigma factor RsiW
MTVPPRPSARCRTLVLELSRYLDGDLSASRRRIVERHVAECDCCGTMTARLRQAIAACRAAGAKRPPRAVRARAAARVKALMAQGAPKSAKLTRRRPRRDR